MSVIYQWRVVGGGCVASELEFENDQMFIQVGITPPPSRKVLGLVWIAGVKGPCMDNRRFYVQFTVGGRGRLGT
ncbi:hypothetical protein GCM10022421_01280 [Oceanisphaera sediminis]|uniref:Uncharacterized protein n=1 Tax=Oceanisphaera sediminis TaxID=981381 RepID=A0ABP7D4Y1_9GAMM